ncbi:hypothetical protein A8135_12960 [Legionella jamestowniensis]|uniref:Substrate of the Dot/Icm secretion system n=1 Tax=Legionella jamestowniensis TaxID=455 RepID=A0ABX2XU17_9GAMM|nr:hypothetical protein [Legionella jamestowniensis]OCH98065.1 hypothetical protein A8135_12960 [Legionella jamestowniensis]
MGTTKYFKQVAQIHKKFSVVQADFNNVMQQALLGLEQRKSGDNPIPDWKLTREVIDRFDKNIQELKTMKEELSSIRAVVGGRGVSIFKHGNIKQKLDQVLSVEEIQNLKTEMKACVNALKKADTRHEYDPFGSYVKEYKEKHLSQELKQTVNQHQQI